MVAALAIAGCGMAAGRRVLDYKSLRNPFTSQQSVPQKLTDAHSAAERDPTM